MILIIISCSPYYDEYSDSSGDFQIYLFYSIQKKVRNIKIRLADNMEVVLNRNYPIFSSKLIKRVILNIN